MIPNFGYDKIEEFFAYDPGGTTGYAKCKVERQNGVLNIYEVGEFPNWAQFEAHLKGKSSEKFAVIYESFHLISSSAVLIPVEVIGVLKFLTDKKSILRYPQKPSERKVAEKIYPEVFQTVSSHGADAVKHAIVFAVFKLGLKNMKVRINGNKKKFHSIGILFGQRL